jgi:hypothetical protein
MIAENRTIYFTTNCPIMQTRQHLFFVDFQEFYFQCCGQDDVSLYSSLATTSGLSEFRS